MTRRIATRTAAPRARPDGPGRSVSTDRRRGGRVHDQRAWVVVDALPASSPVLPAEIDVIETYLGDLLDSLLAARRTN